MIEVNVTLVCQIAHFLCAWWLLRRFLWRQVIAVLDRQRLRTQRLEEQLQNQQQLVAQKQTEIEMLWCDAQQSFSVNTPQFRRPVCLKSATLEQPSFVVDRTVVSTAAQQLAERARHGSF